MNYVTLLALLALMFFGVFKCDYLISQQQKNYIAPLYDSADDMDKCPKTAKFLTEIQSGFLTNYFAIYSACVTGIIMIVFLIVYTLSSTTQPPPPTTIFYILFTCIAVYICVYKVCACILTRICNFHSCASNYIDKTSV